MLQKENGVNEALDEIKEKIELLNEEQDHIDSKRESRVSMIITVFGFCFHYRGGVADIRLLEFRERGDDWGICWHGDGNFGVSFGIMLRAKSK